MNINNYVPSDQNSLSMRLVTCDELRAKAEDVFFEKYDYKKFIEMLEEELSSNGFCNVFFFCSHG